jgi:hypothetical protein
VTINKAGLEYALSEAFTHELVQLCLNSYERGASVPEVSDIRRGRIVSVLSGESDLSCYAESEVDAFIVENWDEVNLIVSRYEKEFDAEVAGGFNLVNPGQVGEA